MKNYALDQKTNGTFFDGLDSLYRRAKSGEDRTRAPAVGSKMWCLFLFVTLRVGRVGYTLNSSCYCVAAYGSIFILFSAFFRSDCPFSTDRQFLFPSLGGATIFEKLWSKIAKSPKIGGKDCAHHFV